MKNASTLLTIINYYFFFFRINILKKKNKYTEFPLAGGAIPNFDFRVVKVSRYLSHYDKIWLSFELLLAIVICERVASTVLNAAKLNANMQSYRLGETPVLTRVDTGARVASDSRVDVLRGAPVERELAVSLDF